jgi:pyrimidine-specific ribonucleoside hydrolase
MTPAQGSYSFSLSACVVDCDPGIDDAVALALIAASPEFDLRAVTTVRGNVTVEKATRNAIDLLDAFGRGDVPVGEGAPRPLVRANPPYPPVHGENGLGGFEIPVATSARHTEPALDLLVRVLASADPGEVTVIALAPLTNLALLLDLRPDLAERIGMLAVMAATVDRGNVTPFAEFNVWADPEAAHRVLSEGGLPTRIFALAATRKAALDEPQRRELAIYSPVGASLAEMILGYDDQVTGAGWPLHDAMVVAGLLEPDIVTLRQASSIAVDTSTGPQRGATTFTWDSPRVPGSPEADKGRAVEPARPLEVAVDADSERFRDLLRERISSPSRSQPA